MERKRKLRIIQFCLLILGLSIISFTYIDLDKNIGNQIISDEKQEKIKEQLRSKESIGQDTFYNIEYTGLDLTGNRYILRAKEAFSNKTSVEIVYMKSVEATFYFKDDTILEVKSDKGVYNNKTLDMNFVGNIKANYDGSELLAQNANYSNSNGFLTITENVKIKDIRGTIVADKLLFDIKKQKLNIESFNDKKVNAKVNLK